MAETWRNKEIRKSEIQKLMVVNNTFVVFDAETTGLKSQDQIIQFSGIKYKIISLNPFKIEGVEEIDVYINPGVSLSDKIVELTGITDEILAGEPKTSEAFPRIREFLENCHFWVGYNIGFDIRMLNQTASKVNEWIDEFPSLDILEMARDWVSNLESKKLADVVTYLYPDKEFQFHSAYEDVKATALVLEALVPKYLEFSETGHNELIHLECGKLFINPQRQSQQRIKLILSEGEEGDIFYDIVNKTWSCKSNTKAKRLFARIDMANLENQFLQKYGYKFGLNSMDEVAKSWMKFRREKQRERKSS